MRTITVAERRARLSRRHGLDGRTVRVTDVARALVGLHASDPATVYLSARARVPGFEVGDLDAAMYDDGALTKHLGMRRTLFVQEASVLPIVQAACTDEIASNERRRLVAAVEAGGVAADGERWLRRAEAATLEALVDLGPRTGQQLSRAVPEIQAKLMYAEGKPWGGQVGVATRVLTVLAAEGYIRRGRPGSWTSSQHRWEVVPGGPGEGVPVADARRALVARWLAAFGPAMLDDIVWWTGLGVTKVRAALAAIGPVEVDLDGRVGLVLAHDVDREDARVPPSAWLLPSLDPTTMGWKERDWYLGPHGPRLFDRNGNAGPTVWWDGRIVGGWAQRPDGEVVHLLLEDVGADAAAAIEAEASALGTWLGGTVVRARFPTPVERELRS